MVTEDIFENNEEQKSSDFVEGTVIYDTEVSEQETVNDAIKQKKKAVKSDVISAVASLVISATPIITDAMNRRREPVPYKIKGSDIARVVVSSAIPLLKVVDTVALNGKINNTMSEKLPFNLNDVRNVVNLVTTYPAVHTMARTTMENISNKENGQVKTEFPYGCVRNTVLGTINLIAPYVVEKFTDDDLTVREKITSVMPLPLLSNTIRRVCSLNPATKNIYDVTRSVVQPLSSLNKSLTSAVRPSGNSTLNKTSSTINGILDTVGDVMGVARGGNGYGYGGYNNNNWGGGRWNSF